MTGLTSALLAAALSLLAAPPGTPPGEAAPERPGTSAVKPNAETAKLAATKEWTLEKHLAVGGQPTAAELKKTADEAYRFIFTDAGFTSSKIVLAYRKGTDYRLQAAEVSLHDFYGSQGERGVETTERKLTADEWNALQAKLKKLDFWNYVPPVEPLGLDGTNWHLEGIAGDKHLMTKIWSPEAGPFRTACLQLWRTSGTFMGYWADKKE